MANYFKDFDFSDFWEDDEYVLADYVEESPTDELIQSIEEEIGGYKLPASYIQLMKMHNGGTPINTCFPTNEATGWADDHVAITGIMGIGRTRTYSLCGELGSNFMKEEWGYPDIGVCIADTPSAGHEMIMLDYRECGKTGEPQVVYVDQESDYEIIFLAENFEAFIRGLVHESEFEEDEEEIMENALQNVYKGDFSPILIKAFENVKDILPDVPERIQKLITKIVKEKNKFLLHADEKSILMYDILFYLYSTYNTAKSVEWYLNNPKQFETSYDLPSYELMIAFCLVDDPFNIHTGGYGPGFLKEWWNSRLENGELHKVPEGYRFTKEAEERVLKDFIQATE